MIADSITIPFQEFLYGRHVPGTVVPEHQLRGADFTELFMDEPTTPGGYLQLPDTGSPEVTSGDEWMPAFFLYKEPTPFDDLCLWYRTRIRCECRLVIHQIQQWVENDTEIPSTLLKFKIVTVQQELLGYLKEAHRRLSGFGPAAHQPEDIQIEMYMTHLLKAELLALFFEINERYEQNLEERLVTMRDLYLKHLRTPFPETNPLVTSAAFYSYFVQKALYNQNTKSKLANLVQRARAEFNGTENSLFKKSLAGSIRQLENITLLYLMPGSREQKSPEQLLQFQENRERIELWISELSRNPVLNEDHELNKLLFKLYIFFEICNEEPAAPGISSTARELIAHLKNHFEQQQNSGLSAEDDSQLITEPAWKNYLSEYVPKSEVRDYFGWEDSKFNRALKEAGIEVAYFSRKDQWLHKTDIDVLIRAHKRPVP